MLAGFYVAVASLCGVAEGLWRQHRTACYGGNFEGGRVVTSTGLQLPPRFPICIVIVIRLCIKPKVSKVTKGHFHAKIWDKRVFPPFFHLSFLNVINAESFSNRYSFIFSFAFVMKGDKPLKFPTCGNSHTAYLMILKFLKRTENFLRNVEDQLWIQKRHILQASWRSHLSFWIAKYRIRQHSEIR